MTAQTIAALSYLAGVTVIGFMFKYRRLSLMISWPYLLYGFGFAIPALVGDRPELAFASGLYSDDNLIVGSLISVGTLLLFLLCDFVILGKTNLSSILSQTIRGTSPVAQLVNNWTFGAAVGCGAGAFSMVYYLAWKAGEIGGRYTYIGIENNKYTGPLSTALEFLIALALLYVYAAAKYGRAVQRRRVCEALFIGCMVARAITGYRLAFVKSTILGLMLLFLILRPKAKHILVGVLIAASVYAFATHIGFSRSSRKEGTGDWFDYVFFLAAESYFNTLPLMMATNNLAHPTYQPGLPIGVAVYLIPRFAGDKVAWSERFYNRNLFTADDNPESLSPVGGMPFLADSMIAYGPMFFLPVVVLAAFLFLIFRRVSSSWRALLMLSIMSGSQQLWRESYANGIKTLLEPYILQYLVLWLATFTILAFPTSRARELCAWRAEHSS